MSITIFKIKKWVKMVLGKSHFHVNQNEGRCYSISEIRGYYNNLTEKITRFPTLDDTIPKYPDGDGNVREFSIAIFQYGLAAYDLWLENGDESYIRKFKNCVDWAILNQEESGAWETFKPQNANNPYSAMAQGEGISLLVRAYIFTKDQDYLIYLERAFKFLMKPLEQGGVAEYSNGNIRLYEYTYLPLVLNGWIFASWGVLDYYKLTKDESVGKVWRDIVKTLVNDLHRFDVGYWSLYHNGNAMASPFYHRLHIAQLNVMYELTKDKVFQEYSRRWEKYLRNPIYKAKALCIKIIQKIVER